MKLGRLYGVGVGPGAPDLLTIRALRVIQNTAVLAIPRPNDYSKSLAFRIVKDHLAAARSDQEKLFLTFPMSKDKDVLQPFWEAATLEVAIRLRQGLDVAFITQGDPLIYSTFIYLMEAIRDVVEGVEVETIPAVTSIAAVPSAALTPLCDGMEKVAVLPATYGLSELKKILRDFDSVVLMKVGSVMPQVVEALQQEGLLSNAVYVERATTDQERVVHDLLSLKNDKCIYFSMVVVTKRDRAGVLVDTNKLAKVLSDKLAETEI